MPRWIRWFWERFRQPVDTPRESDVPTDPTVASSRPQRSGRDTAAGHGSETFVGRLSDDFSAEEQSGAEQRKHGKAKRD
ncbi:MAG: hypothetical protein GEU97_00855 [Actinophytocola sp.]|nr:hypothetical protein [Actinophytocola sp.]